MAGEPSKKWCILVNMKELYYYYKLRFNFVTSNTCIWSYRLCITEIGEINK